jgi:polyisoprenyl-phosphate glycosyltransferase
MLSVSFILPVYNNATTLAALTRQLYETSQNNGNDAEFVFVNDASNDNSAEILLQLKKQYTGVSIIQLAKNYGQSVALIVGLAHATHDISICMDADLQDPPAAVPLLLQEISSRKTSVVFAGRMGKYESGSRHFSAHVFKQLFSLLTGGKIPANAGLFFAIQTHAAASFIEYAGSKPYLLALIFQRGLSCASVPVQRQHRPGGGSGYTAWKRWKTGIMGLVSLMPVSRKKLPMQFISVQ